MVHHRRLLSRIYLPPVDQMVRPHTPIDKPLQCLPSSASISPFLLPEMTQTSAKRFGYTTCEGSSLTPSCLGPRHPRSSSQRTLPMPHPEKPSAQQWRYRKFRCDSMETKEVYRSSFSKGMSRTDLQGCVGQSMCQQLEWRPRSRWSLRNLEHWRRPAQSLSTDNISSCSPS